MVIIFNKDSNIVFIVRFTLLHVFTYFIFGIIFFNIFNYTQVFEQSELLSILMRPTDSPIVQAAVLFQLIRGPILAIAFVFIRKIFTKNKYGWLHIWAMLFILTGIGAVIPGPGTIEGMIYTNLTLTDHIGGGLIEISLQMLAFSLLLWKWECKVQK